jgi:hypothetical protein
MVMLAVKKCGMLILHAKENRPLDSRYNCPKLSKTYLINSFGALEGKGLIYFSNHLSERSLRFLLGQQSVVCAVGSFCYSEFKCLCIYFFISILISVVLCPVLVDLWDIPEVATGTYLP